MTDEEKIASDWWFELTDEERMQILMNAFRASKPSSKAEREALGFKWGVD
jgi:hypothetical protein